MAEDFIDFATKKNSSIYGPSSKYPVYYLGTYWDVPPKPARESIQANEGLHLFVNPIIAIVSVEEHQKEFGFSPTKKQVMGRTEEIMDNADAEITIQGDEGTSDYSIGQLQRIQVPFREKQQLSIGKGVWPNYPNGGYCKCLVGRIFYSV